MKQAIAIRHLAFEDLGLLQPLLQERGYAVRYLDAGVDPITPELIQADLLIVLGGPISANDQADYPFLTDELALIRQRLELKQPTLGICLGAQLMALALGAEVTAMAGKEIGYGPLSLTDAGLQSPLAALSQPATVLHWHGEQFSLPEGALNLAHTALCGCQGFALEYYALGLQFHLEADPARLEQWLIGHCCELAQTGLSPATIRDQQDRLGAEVAHVGQQVFRQWLDELDNPS